MDATTTTGTTETETHNFVLELHLLDRRVLTRKIAKPATFDALQRAVAAIEPPGTGFVVIRTEGGAMMTPESFPIQENKAAAHELPQCVKPRIKPVGYCWERDEYRQQSEHGKLSEFTRTARAVRQEDATWR
jgi:hypothetical protein